MPDENMAVRSTSKKCERHKNLHMLARYSINHKMLNVDVCRLCHYCHYCHYHYYYSVRRTPPLLFHGKYNMRVHTI